MRALKELLEINDPGIVQIRKWIQKAANECVLLPPSESRGEALVQTQVTTRSTMGAIVYETGGVLVDGGWLRFLGSGHSRITRTLPGWNEGRSKGFYLVADDAVGGFFAINGGAFGPDVKHMYYWAPNSLDWKPLNIGFTDFFVWSLSDRLSQFYESLRWPSWRADIAELSGDRCFAFYPELWTKEGSLTGSYRETAPAAEAFDLKAHIVRQLSKPTNEQNG
jgi:hypothetical protein